MPDSFCLSLAAMDILWERQGLGGHVFPFTVPSFGELLADRARIADAVLRDLESRRLARSGRLEPDVAAALTLLARPATAIAVVASLEDDQQLFARIAVRDRVGVRVVRDGDLFYFDHIRPDRLLTAALELLPDEPAGPGYPVTLTGAGGRTAWLEDDQENAPVFGRGRSGGGGQPSQRLAAEAMFHGPKRRAGYFVVFCRGRDGRERTATGLGWFDNDRGRYLMRGQTGRDGRQWASLAPAEPGRLAAQLRDLVGSVAPNPDR